MLATTSDANRKPIWTFGASAFGRPSLRRNSAMASTMPGSTSAIGLNRRISSAVRSRTSPSLSAKGLRIGLLLSFVRLAKTDDPARVNTHAVTNRVESSEHRNQREIPLFAIIAPLIGPNARSAPIQFCSRLERQSALGGVPCAFRRVKLNLHELL